MIKIFRNFGEEATIYAGDLKREESILEWMMVQKDPSNEVKKTMQRTNEWRIGSFREIKKIEIFEIVNDRLPFILVRPWTNDLEIVDLEVVHKLDRLQTIQKLFVTIGNDFVNRTL